jgi:hypothetical protein
LMFLEDCHEYHLGGYPADEAHGEFYARFVGKVDELMEVWNDLVDMHGPLIGRWMGRVFSNDPESRQYSLTVWLTPNQAMLVKLKYHA